MSKSQKKWKSSFRSSDDFVKRFCRVFCVDSSIAWYVFFVFHYVIGGSSLSIYPGRKRISFSKTFSKYLDQGTPMICIRVLPDSHWISGEPSGQKSNVFGPFEMLAEEICLAMARTNWWEWTGWGGQIGCRSISEAGTSMSSFSWG